MKAFFRRFSVFILVIVLVASISPIQQARAITINTLDTVVVKRVTTPSNLTAKLSSGMGVTLNWTDNSSNEGGFLLQRRELCGSIKSGWADLSELPANTTTYKDTITMVLWSTGHEGCEYRVKALGSGLVADSIYTAETRIIFRVPEAPQITLQFAADASVLVKWSGCTEAYVDYYVIKRKAPGAASFTDVATVAANTSTYYDASQKLAGIYEYTVHAIGYFSDYLPNLVNSSLSSSVSITIPSAAPSAPTNLVLTPTSENSAQLTWVDNAVNESGFRIDWSINGVAQSSIYVDKNVQTYNLSAMPSGALVAKVKAINAFGFSAFANTVTASIPMQPPSSIDYSSASSWAKPEIEAANTHHLLTSKLSNNFQQKITREEFCEIAVRLYEALSHTQAIFDGNNPFTDTTNNEVIKAYKLGITNGTAPDKFSPNNLISRQEICVMLVKTMQAALPGVNIQVANPNVFADEGSIASWATPYVKYSFNKGIMTGTGGNAFDPLNITPREQAIAIINRTYVAYIA